MLSAGNAAKRCCGTPIFAHPIFLFQRPISLSLIFGVTRNITAKLTAGSGADALAAITSVQWTTVGPCGKPVDADEDEDKDDDCDVVDAAVFAAVLTALLVFADVVADADADVLVLVALVVLSGKPPASAFDALAATAPTTSDFNSWRIDCAPQNSKHQNDIAPSNFSTPLRMTNKTVTTHRITV